jgi:SHS2 domain-containing protein
MAKQPPWEEIEHTADLALRARGEDRRALFRNAALGLAALCEGESESNAIIHRHIALSAPDWETLLYDWLSEMLYIIEEHTLVLTEVVIDHTRDCTLNADIAGHPEGRFLRLVKAVTFHNLAIRQTEEGYEATIVFDV